MKDITVLTGVFLTGVAVYFRILKGTVPKNDRNDKNEGE